MSSHKGNPAPAGGRCEIKQQQQYQEYQQEDYTDAGLARDVADVNDLTLQLSREVDIQGTMLDRIDVNIESSATNVKEGSTNIKEGHKEQTKANNTFKWLVIIGVLVVICLSIALYVKWHQ
jgi:t-SNARE complex subunit (syntaxin)